MEVHVRKEHLTAIADAIRENTGSESTYKLNEMPDAIDNIRNESIEATFTSSNPYGGCVAYNIEKLPTINISVANCNNLLKNFQRLKEVDINFIEKPTSFDNMFSQCRALEKITFNNLDSSDLLNMQEMFTWCIKLKNIPNFNTENVTDMFYMCYGCESLTTVPLLDTSQATNMQGMFSGCINLVTVPVLDTSKATSIGGMFGNGATQNMTDESLNNILIMCINATSYTGEKTLCNGMGFGWNWTPASKIQSLPKYQDFLAAGWTIGY